MRDDEVVTITVTRRDAGRLLAGARERQRKLKKGVTKFGADFDPEKGRNMTEGLAAYNKLIETVEGQLNA